LAITGEVSRPDLSHIRVQLHGMLTTGLRHLVVDLSGVREADPRLGVSLDRTNRRLRAMQGSITTVNVAREIIPILADRSLRSRVARWAQAEADAERGEAMIWVAAHVAHGEDTGKAGLEEQPARHCPCGRRVVTGQHKSIVVKSNRPLSSAV
jgi:hypothetical protein